MKLQNDVLKAISKQETSVNGRYANFPYKVTTGSGKYLNTGITDGHFIKFYNDKHFFVKTDNDYFNVTPYDVTKITDLTNARLLKFEMEFKTTINGSELSLIKFSFLDNDDECYINADFKKYYETKYIKFSDFTFYAINEKSPVIIRDGEYIHGAILPIRFNKKGGV